MFSKILLLLIFLSLHGCISSHYYILSTPSTPKKSYTQKQMRLGVEKVTLPKYLFKREIAIAKSNQEIVFLSNGTWAEDLEEGLTLRLIGFLQKKFNQPNIYTYPWGSTIQPRRTIHLTISRFIAQNNKVFLDASWEIHHLKTEQHTSKLFSISLPTNMDTPDIIATMHHAFSHLEKKVSESLLYHY